MDIFSTSLLNLGMLYLDKEAAIVPVGVFSFDQVINTNLILMGILFLLGFLHKFRWIGSLLFIIISVLVSASVFYFYGDTITGICLLLLLLALFTVLMSLSIFTNKYPIKYPKTMYFCVIIIFLSGSVTWFIYLAQKYDDPLAYKESPSSEGKELIIYCKDRAVYLRGVYKKDQDFKENIANSYIKYIELDGKKIATSEVNSYNLVGDYQHYKHSPLKTLQEVRWYDGNNTSKVLATCTYYKKGSLNYPYEGTVLSRNEKTPYKRSKRDGLELVYNYDKKVIRKNFFNRGKMEWSETINLLNQDEWFRCDMKNRKCFNGTITDNGVEYKYDNGKLQLIKSFTAQYSDNNKTRFVYSLEKIKKYKP